MENHLFPLGPPNSVRESANFLLKIDRRLQQRELMILPMIRRDIADYLGLTFETVSRSLSTLRDEGILSFTRSTHARLCCMIGLSWLNCKAQRPSSSKSRSEDGRGMRPPADPRYMDAEQSNPHS
jgi:Crp-like helix-turn-helix domain